MTTGFGRVDFGPTERPFPLRKLSMSSQEWCGHVYHQVVPQAPQAGQPARWLSTSHSYFDGEADAQRPLVIPAHSSAAAGPVVAEDELPVVLRRFAERREFLSPGESRTVVFLPSLARARLSHQPLAFTEAVITRLREPLPLRKEAGEFSVVSYQIRIKAQNGDGEDDSATFQFATTPPYVLVHYRWQSGQEASLLATTRLPYWQLHENGHEALLKQLGLPVRELMPAPGPTPKASKEPAKKGS
jgi:hypothetical protein